MSAGTAGAPQEIERKFLLAGPPDLTLLAAACDGMHTVEIEQRYLPAPAGVERRVRRTVTAGTTSYVITEKRPSNDPRIRTEIERPAGVAEWNAAVAATTGSPIVKTRRSFDHADHRFELDQFHAPLTAWLLEVELDAADQHVTLPPFLGPLTEVTADPAWRNSALSRRTPAG